MSVYAYVRYSPTAKEDGASLEVQATAINRHAAACGEEVAYVFRDIAVSGKNTKRPGLRQMLDTVKRGDRVVCYSLSRLSRSTIDTCNIATELQSKGVDLVLLDMNMDTSTPLGTFFLHVTAALAELERKQIGQRTSDAMKTHMMNRRKVSSKPPYGWRFEGDKLVADDHEQRGLTHIFAWDKLGWTPNRIAAELNKMGYSPRGKSWHRWSVKRILDRGQKIHLENPEE